MKKKFKKKNFHSHLWKEVFQTLLKKKRIAETYNPPNIIPSFGIMCSRRRRGAITITFHFHPTKRRINHANALLSPLLHIWRFTNRNYQTTAIHELSAPLFFPFRFQLKERCARPGSHAAGTRGNCYYFRWNCATSVSLARHPARKENSHSKHLRLLFLAVVIINF